MSQPVRQPDLSVIDIISFYCMTCGFIYYRWLTRYSCIRFITGKQSCIHRVLRIFFPSFIVQPVQLLRKQEKFSLLLHYFYHVFCKFHQSPWGVTIHWFRSIYWAHCLRCSSISTNSLNLAAAGKKITME